MKKMKVVLIGAGQRGITYTDIMSQNPERYEVVAVAEPIESRRNYIQKKHGIPGDRCFADWAPLIALGKIADVAVIATMDRDHFAPAMAAIGLGYDLLLEKPIAPLPEECKKITDFAEEKGVKVVICTVLRYTNVFIRIKEIIDSGKIGKVMSINHEEGVGNIHQTHSFVRGNWGNSDTSSDMLLQKSCHDMDILQWLLGKKCKKVQSFGTLSYFKEESAPSGSPEYCIQGCPAQDTCPYNAVKIYFDDKKNDWFRTTSTREAAPTDEQVKNAITNTQYGKCVFKCNNNVVDHQTVNMLFEDDITVTFNMNAFCKPGRRIQIMGTRGEIRAALDGQEPITVYNHDTQETKTVPLVAGDGIVSGHGGGDRGIIEALYEYLVGEYHGKSIPTIQESCYNHMIVFAAEKARRTNTVVDVDAYINSL